MPDNIINKVVYGSRTLIDLTDDTVEPQYLKSGYTAHDKSGQVITGTLTTDLQSKSVSFIPSESIQTSTVTYDSNYDGLDEVNISIAAISSTYVGTGIARLSSADLTIAGSTITAPAGYYSSNATGTVAAGEAFTPATTITTNPTISINSSTGVITASYNGSSSITPTVSAGYISTGTAGIISTTGTNTLSLNTQSASTITPTESVQTAVSANTYTVGKVQVGAISSTYVGSGIDRNDSDDLIISGDTITAAAGYYSSTATKTIEAGSATTPATTITANPTISIDTTTGLITATATSSKSVTPTVEAGYISEGTAGTITVSGSNTSQLTTKAATTITPTESEQVAVNANIYTLGQIKVGAISSNYVGSNIPQNSAADLSISGPTVTVPTGYYSSNVIGTVDSGSAFTPAITITQNPTVTINSSTGVVTATYNGSSSVTPTVIAGYVSQGTAGTVSTSGTNTLSLTTQASSIIIPTESIQTAVAAGKYTLGAISVAAISSDYVGTNITRNSAADLTTAGSTVTVPVGYYSSEVTKNISGGSAFTPAVTITTNPTITLNSTTGVITATYNSSSSITPTVTAGYISTGVAGIVSATGTNTFSLTTKASATYIPTTVDQYIDAGQYLIGSQTIKGDANLVALNIKSGISIFGVEGALTGGATAIYDEPDSHGGTIRYISTDLIISGTSNITSNGTYNIASYVQAVVSVSASLQVKSVSFTPAETLQTSTVTFDTGYDGLSKVDISVAAISSDYVGTNIPRKSAANLTANNSTVTVPSGYYSSQVTKNISAGEAFTPDVSITTNPTITVNNTTGLITASYSGSSSITPVVSAGYISAGISGVVSVGGTSTIQLTTQPAITVTPTENIQTVVESNTYTLGQIKVDGISSTYIGSGVPTNSAADLTASGSTVTVPSGFYSSVVTKNISSATTFSPAISINSSTGVVTGTNTFISGYYVASTKTSTLALSTKAAETVTPTESVQVAVEANRYTLGQVKVGAISSTYVGSGIPQNSAADLTTSGPAITIPSGFYLSILTKDVEITTAFAPAISLNSSTGVITGTNTFTDGYISASIETSTINLSVKAATIITPTESIQTAVSAGYFTTGVISVAAISSNYVGSNIPQNSVADLTVSNSTVTTPAGYYSSSVSKSIASGSAFTPAVTITENPIITLNSTTGIITAAYAGSSLITPAVTAGYITAGTPGTISTAGTVTYQLASQAAQTITPGTSDITISAGKYLIGSQIIKGDANLKAVNIANGVSIFGVVGTHEGGITPTGTLTILSNGTYDVTTYASAIVSLSMAVNIHQEEDGSLILGDEDADIISVGELTVTSNGTYTASDGLAYSLVIVSIPTYDRSII